MQSCDKRISAQPCPRIPVAPIPARVLKASCAGFLYYIVYTLHRCPASSPCSAQSLQDQAVTPKFGPRAVHVKAQAAKALPWSSSLLDSHVHSSTSRMRPAGASYTQIHDEVSQPAFHDEVYLTPTVAHTVAIAMFDAVIKKTEPALFPRDTSSHNVLFTSSAFSVPTLSRSIMGLELTTSHMSSIDENVVVCKLRNTASNLTDSLEKISRMPSSVSHCRNIAMVPSSISTSEPNALPIVA